MLDLWQQNTGVAARPQQGEGSDLPATFGDSFDAAWHDGQLFSSSIASANARLSALDDFSAEVLRKTGQRLEINPEGGADPWQQANDQVQALKQKGFAVDPLSDDEVNRRAAAVAGDTHRAAQEMGAREKTLGGKIGGVLGGLASGSADPINLVGAAIAPEAELGVLGTAALWGGYGIASQSVNEAANAQFRQQAMPGYDEAAGNILEAGVGGAVLGGLFKGLGATWTRMKTGEWPRSVRDAGNIVESEANIQRSNVLPGAEGEAAHRQAMGKAIDDIVAGRGVSVETPAVDAPIDAAMASRSAANGEKTIRFYHGTAYEDASGFTGQTFVTPYEDYARNYHGGPNNVLYADLTKQEAIDSGLWDEVNDKPINGSIENGAARLRPLPKQGELPFGAPENTSAAGLSDQIAGLGVPKDDASALAGRVLAAKSDDEARAILNEAMARPATIANTVPSVSAVARAERAAQTEVVIPTTEESRIAALTDPNHEQALTTELERLRDTGQGGMIPVGVDEKGEPKFQLLDAALQDAENDRNAADQIEACINPPAEEAAE